MPGVRSETKKQNGLKLGQNLREMTISWKILTRTVRHPHQTNRSPSAKTPFNIVQNFQIFSLVSDANDVIYRVPKNRGFVTSVFSVVDCNGSNLTSSMPWKRSTFELTAHIDSKFVARAHRGGPSSTLLALI